MKIAGFDNHMFEGAAIAVGSGAVAEGGEIALVGDGVSLTIDRSTVADGSFMDLLRRILGEVPDVFKLRTSGACLWIEKNGDVFVNDKLVGNDPTMLPRVLYFFLKSAIPQVACAGATEAVVALGGGK